MPTDPKNQFKKFLKELMPQVEKKNTQRQKAAWLLAITGSQDAADLSADLTTELRLLFSDKEKYNKLVKWEKTKKINSPIKARELNVLIREFKDNMLPQDLLDKISILEAKAEHIYSNFRPKMKGKPMSENDIKEILKKENSIKRRKETWNISKKIGTELAPIIQKLVALRNKGARLLGFPGYYQMQLELQEVDQKWLLKTLDKLAKDSNKAHEKMLEEVNKKLTKRFKVSESQLGPWAWSEPFGQEDPITTANLDSLIKKVDIIKTACKFYNSIGIKVQDVLDRSDLYEREGKNQHAFCIDIDRAGDVRTLTNIKQTIRWLEIMLHELGHAVYELGINKKLPWLLRSAPHMITTEAMALIAGRQAFQPKFLKKVIKNYTRYEKIVKRAQKSEHRRQLIFSRWVMVMVNFEASMYVKPKQDLNKLWWSLVEKYQGIKPPRSRKGKDDWAAKYHIGLAPVYYHSYLLGEMFASMLTGEIKELTSDESTYGHKQVGQFLNDNLFGPGDSMRWDKLVEHATGKKLTPDAWIREFVSIPT